MQRKAISVQTPFFLLLSTFALFASYTHSIQAGENESTRKLVSLVGNDDADLWKEAPKLYASIPVDSTFKPVASQAMALIELRQGNYSDAWKLLNAQSSDLSSAPLAYRLGHEKLMLWLWLQAGSAAQAESQFKRLVAAAINQELPDPERRDVCYFLGGIVGMLQSAGDPMIVAATTLEKGRVSLEGFESKLAVEPFERGFESAKKWYQDIRSKLEPFAQAVPNDANAMLATIKQDLERLLGEQSTLAEEIKVQQLEKQLMDEELKKLKKNQNWLKAAWNTVTPGRPVIPTKPRRPSSPRTEYEKTYTIDSKTGERTETGRREKPPSPSERREYERKMEVYEKSLRSYENAVQTYPARLAEWYRADAIRRANLQESKKKIDAEVANKKSLIDEMQANVKEKIASSKSFENELRQAKASIAIASVATQPAKSKSSVIASIVKPSNFELLAFDSEVLRLEKCLRETRR